MQNISPVSDEVCHFIIDPTTKEISAKNEVPVLVQYSKNTERITFKIPGTVIDGHDISACNSVSIHFRNIDKQTLKTSSGIYTVTDLSSESNALTLSWLIGDAATVYTGKLDFSIHFACIDGGKAVYNFPTLTCSLLTVGPTVWNSETIAKEHPDIIAAFESRIASLEQGGIGQGPQNAILYSQQALTAGEQAQARENIGAVTSAEVAAIVETKISGITNAEEVAY